MMKQPCCSMKQSAQVFGIWQSSMMAIKEMNFDYRSIISMKKPNEHVWITVIIMVFANKAFVFVIRRTQALTVRSVNRITGNIKRKYIMNDWWFFLAQCTDLCSGHGVVEHGRCRCHEGWHGAECQLMSNQCEIPNCNNRGTCISGQCVCQTGYQGKFCEQSKSIRKMMLCCFSCIYISSNLPRCEL